jgi:hypothetical protein
MDMGKLAQILYQKHKIYIIAVGIPSEDMGGENISGMRVTPSIYTTLRELDIFIDAVSNYVKNGLPGQ